MNDRLIEIGTLTLLAPHTFRVADYECAAWWQKVACQPQTVPLIGTNTSMQLFDHRGAEQIDFYWVSAGFHGIVTDCDFGSRYGGLPIGDSRETNSRYIGKEADYRWSTYGYNMANAVAEHGLSHLLPYAPPIRVDLDPSRTAFAQSMFEGRIHNKLYPVPGTPVIPQPVRRYA